MAPQISRNATFATGIEKVNSRLKKNIPLILWAYKMKKDCCKKQALYRPIYGYNWIVMLEGKSPLILKWRRCYLILNFKKSPVPFC